MGPPNILTFSSESLEAGKCSPVLYKPHHSLLCSTQLIHTFSFLPFELVLLSVNPELPGELGSPEQSTPLWNLRSEVVVFEFHSPYFPSPLWSFHSTEMNWIFPFAGMKPGAADQNYIQCESELSLKDPQIDMRTGKMCSKPIEVAQPLPPLLQTEIKQKTKKTTKKQKEKKERQSHHNSTAHLPCTKPRGWLCLFKQEVAVILCGWAGQLDLNVTWHGIHGNVGLKGNGLLPVTCD